VNKDIQPHSFGRNFLARENGAEQVLGTADERVASLVEAEELIGRPRDADSNGFADEPGGMLRRAEPQCAGSAKVEAVVAAVDLKSGGKTAGASRKIENPCGLAVLLHECDAIERFKRADEDSCSGPGRFADNIEHEVRAVVEENVGVTGGQIHRANTRRGSSEMMACGIAGRICFRFYNAAA